MPPALSPAACTRGLGVTSCPAAAQGLSCRAAFKLAELWGVALSRSIGRSESMLRKPARWAGRRLAGVVALLYLAGVVMPSVALAFWDGAASAYCFDEIVEQVAALHIQGHDHVHIHSDGTVHHHVDQASSPAIPGENGGGGPGSSHQGHSHEANCCGSFGFSAVLPVFAATVAEPAAYQIQRPILTRCLIGCSPDRIDRPPIALLPR